MANKLGFRRLFLLKLTLWAIECSSLSLLAWALVHFAQGNSSTESVCSDRVTADGFVGNTDFYGLGIRLGIYSQWAASALANCFLPGEWKSNLGASLAFALALVVAIFLLTFQSQCVFTAEVIVILFIFWGGFLVSYIGSPALNFVNPLRSGAKSPGSGIVAEVPYVAMQVFSLWFWLRLVLVGEEDFRLTPGGTYYFLFSRVSAHSKAGAGFITALCALYAWYTASSLIGFAWGLVQVLGRGYFEEPDEDLDSSSTHSTSNRSIRL